jgi:hypothetical protein
MQKTFMFLLPAAVLAAGLYAQKYRGRIQGTVGDTSQAAITGATITLMNVKTVVPAVRQTNEAGHYPLDLADPGIYALTVEFQGFSKLRAGECHAAIAQRSHHGCYVEGR